MKNSKRPSSRADYIATILSKLPEEIQEETIRLLQLHSVAELKKITRAINQIFVHIEGQDEAGSRELILQAIFYRSQLNKMRLTQSLRASALRQ